MWNDNSRGGLHGYREHVLTPHSSTTATTPTKTHTHTMPICQTHKAYKWAVKYINRHKRRTCRRCKHFPFIHTVAYSKGKRISGEKGAHDNNRCIETHTNAPPIYQYNHNKRQINGNINVEGNHYSFLHC